MGTDRYDLRHILQAYWTYELPFGSGRRFNISNAVLDQIFGGWALSGIARTERSALPAHQRTANTQPAGFGVILNGITVEELQKKVNARPGAMATSSSSTRT